MQTTWKIKDGARWHDGAPLTSADLIFTATVGQDTELAAFRDRNYDNVASVEAQDAQTVSVRWRRPFIDADTLFTRSLAFPLPRHLLEAAYTQSKATFTQVPYWSEEFVGAGPFKLRGFERGVRLILEANGSYVLGRPKIDEIEVRFIPDANALLASILGGAVDLTLGRSLSLDQAIQVRDQWPDGNVAISFRSWILIQPQFVDANPPLVADARFRRALVQAVNRQQLADGLQAGLVPIAHAMLGPASRSTRMSSPASCAYEYDPGRAGQIMEGLGYTRHRTECSGTPELKACRSRFGPSGATTSTRNRSLQWRTTGNALGVGVEQVLIPPQRLDDREWRATFPGFQLLRQPNDVAALKRYQGGRCRLDRL